MKRTVCLVLVFFASQVLSSLAVLFFFNLPRLLHGEWPDADTLVASPAAMGLSLLLNGAVVWAAMTLLGWIDDGSFRSGRARWPTYAAVVLWMTPVIFIVNLLLETLTLEDLKADVFTMLVHDFWGASAVILVGPFTEETVFRMGIQGYLVRHGLRPWAAIAISALIFGAVHGNPAQIPGAAVFGLVFGWLYWRSETIWIPVAAHVFNNLVGVAMIWCTGGADTTLSGLCGGAGGASVWALAAALCGYAGYRYLDKAFGEKEGR